MCPTCTDEREKFQKLKTTHQPPRRIRDEGKSQKVHNRRNSS